MKQGRTPDRVHVVHTPTQDDYRGTTPNGQLPAAPQNTRAMEIIRTLAAISDKLKRSEAERYELLAELREYRKSLNELEDRAEKSEKAYLSLENKIKSRETLETEASQRQARFERALKDAESKLVQAAAGQSLLDQRLKDSEEFRTSVNTRLDETVLQQARLDRQIEKIGQDKSRMLRKVERMEEILTETQDTLKARALVLLTDQSNAGNLPQLSAYGDAADTANSDAPWWRKSVRMQSVGMVSMIAAALLFGWTINQIQQPEMPKIAVLENGGLARLNMKENTWEAVPSNAAAPTALSNADATLVPADGQTIERMNSESASPEQTPAAQDAINASDEELMKALEENPDGLAAQLNEIAPGTRQELDMDQPVTTATPAPEPVQTAALPPASGAYDPLKPVAARAFAQDPQIANIVAKEKAAGTLMSRIPADNTLPAQMKDLEGQAFAGVPEAQHDLAAIYTAGRGGVTQNFEKAAIWFREAADQKIANADYNLGVLYHQGLGVEKDLDRALYWYREAAKLGHPEAQYNLGIAYIEGIGTEYNAPVAAAFFESAANQGIVEAAYNLGLIYENGLVGGGAKPEDALLWYKIAADGGSTDAKAAMTQLSSVLNIKSDDVSKMIEKMQANYERLHGRKAGPGKTA
jgi:TPR repeat protein